MTARAGSALALGLLVSWLVAVVANDLRLVPPAAELTERMVLAVRLAGLAALALAVVLLWRRPAARRGGSGGTGQRTAAVRQAALIVGLLTMAALLANPIRVRGPALGPGPGRGVPDFGLGSGGGDGPPSRDVGGSSAIRGRALESAEEGSEVVRLDDGVTGSAAADRVRRMLGPLVVLLIGLVVLRMLMRSPSAADPAPPGRSSDASEPTSDRSGVSADPFVGRSGPFDDDPRGRIAAAYHRLLTALSGAGMGRRREEGPHEHLDRATAAEPGAAPLHEVAALYVMAEFGGGELSDQHGGAAERAIAEGLRWLAGASGRAR